MTKFVNSAYAAGGIARLMSGIGPKIMLEAPNDGGGDDAATKAAAEAAAAKAAREAAEKAAADKVAAEEAARLEAEKNMSEAEKEKQKLLREVMDKKAKLKDAETRTKDLEDQLKRFDGIDLDKVKTLLEAETNRERDEAEKKGEFDRVKKMMVEAHEADKKKLSEESDTLKTKLAAQTEMIDQLTIGADFAGSKFISEDLVLTPTKARALYGSHFEVKDGRTIAYDKPKGAAGRTEIVDGTGQPMSFDDAFRKIIDLDPDKETLLKSKMKPGATSKSDQIRTPQQSQQPKQKELYGAARIRASFGA